MELLFKISIKVKSCYSNKYGIKVSTPLNALEEQPHTLHLIMTLIATNYNDLIKKWNMLKTCRVLKQFSK